MKMYDNFKLLIQAFSLFCLLMAADVYAESFSASQLTAAGELWLNQQIHESGSQVSVYPLDPRLADRQCDNALQFSLVNPKVQTQNSIRVLCDDANGWQLYLSAKVTRMIEVAVSTRQLAAGTIFTDDMLKIEARDQMLSRGAVVIDLALITGARAKRSLSLGQIITQQDVCLVCKGDLVTIEGISGTLVVATSGKALADGSLGDSIQVKNMSSGRTVQASVIAVKKVAITL